MRIEGERTPLRPSTSHPFWVKRGESAPGWMPAAEMRLGDLVQSMQGAWRMVVAITPLPGQQTVYNFTVDQNHDYFVGEQGLLVHNAGPVFSYPTFDYRDLQFDSWDPVSNPSGVYEVPASGSYGADRAELLRQVGIDPSDAIGYDAHHIDYDPETNTMRMQLVDRDIHRAEEFDHVGGVEKYERITGCEYVWP